MGINNAEVFCNIALCCLKAHQFDIIVPCIENALALGRDGLLADIWYNMGYVALTAGKLELASTAWKISLTINSNHSEACNNLAVLALMDGKTSEGKALLNV